MRWIQGLGLDGVGRRGAELGSWRGWVDMELGGMNCFVLAPSVFFLGQQGGDEVSLLQMDASVVFQSEVAGGLGIATPPRKSRYFMSSKSHTRHRWETAFVQIQQKQSAHAILTTPRRQRIVPCLQRQTMDPNPQNLRTLGLGGTSRASKPRRSRLGSRENGTPPRPGRQPRLKKSRPRAPLCPGLGARRRCGCLGSCGPRGGFGGSACFRRRWLGAGWMAAGITPNLEMVESWEVGWRWRSSGLGRAR